MQKACHHEGCRTRFQIFGFLETGDQVLYGLPLQATEGDGLLLSLFGGSVFGERQILAALKRVAKN